MAEVQRKNSRNWRAVETVAVKDEARWAGRISFGGFRFFRGFFRGGFRTLLVNVFRGGIMHAEIVLRGFVSLARGADEPFDGQGGILFHAAARLITQPQIALGVRQFLLGGGLDTISRPRQNPAGPPGRFHKRRPD